MAAIFAGSSRVDAVFAPITTLPSCQVRVSRSPVAATRDLGSRGRFASRQTRVGALVSCGHGRLRRMVRRRWFVADLARELTGAVSFVECAAELAPDVQATPTAAGGHEGWET